MKILITGGGSGGHVYPLLAVADKIREISEEKNILQPEIIYLATEPYDQDSLFRNDITFEKIFAGKLRRGFHFSTIWEVMKMSWGVLASFTRMIQIYPDVVFTNGGYVAFPVLVSARILRIPVVIHVSDTVPSRVLLFAGKFSEKISVAFPEAIKYFDEKKVAVLGNPIRDEIKHKQRDGSHRFFNLSSDKPVILILGGSQGSQIINDNVLEALPKLVEKYQVIHQTGKNNYEDIYGTSGVILLDNPLKKRYKVFPYLDDLSMKKAAGISNLVVMRSGAGSINEVANWGIPSILIPISKEVSRDQESNSFSYARSGAGIVIRQKNLSPNILIFEVNRIFDEKNLHREMSHAAKEFYKPDAAFKIANAILDIALSHQK
jgi:UDP-N-acetylglucosamine--N-acetylmuramyl-(pentapeptide) pyrophosphoryl-undecaprenol N-acetylglucosamine transferase